VLPESPKVHLERSGSQRWLVVNDKVEKVWPQVLAFWQENGFEIKTENMQAGIIETEWNENRAKIPMDGLRKYIGKLIDSLYDSGERDMYHVRLERSKDGNSTEIYLSQYGKEEILTADKVNTKWQSRPNDPELEATMLQMLMAKLAGADVQAQAQIEVASSAGAASVRRLETLTNGSKVILLSQPFDRSWRTVGLALEHEGFLIEDKDRANGVYFVHVEEAAKDKGLLDKLAFWRKEDSVKPLRYQVTVHESKDGCEVAANNGSGESTPNSQRIIDSLYKALGK
jgi:outer membrane protein assembly factor BamC